MILSRAKQISYHCSCGSSNIFGFGGTAIVWKKLRIACRYCGFRERKVEIATMYRPAPMEGEPDSQQGDYPSFASGLLVFETVRVAPKPCSTKLSFSSDGAVREV
jgi:DNA-directed RNA polymerase subunit RPC12/RpoP